MSNRILIDSGFLFALNDHADEYHDLAVIFANIDQSTFIVPDPVLTEVCYLLRTRIGHHAQRAFLKTLAKSTFQLQPVTMPDIQRAYEIMEQYQDARLDFVDCCIMALAERLNVTQICTFDRRDFAIFTPTHCDFLDLMS